MTAVTGKPLVLPPEREWELTVIEGMAKAVDTVVAIQAGTSISQGMRRHKRHIHFAVAGIAGTQLECGYIAGVTIGTGKRFTRNRQRVTVQGESHRLMRECRVVQLRKSGICAAVLRMAVTAPQVRVVMQHGAVH